MYVYHIYWNGIVSLYLTLKIENGLDAITFSVQLCSHIICGDYICF
jgi:hypothetical protein